MWIVNDQTVDGSETGTSFRQALWAMECGFNLHDTMIWDKCGSSFPDANRYLPTFEFMFVFSKGAPITVNLICDRKNNYVGTKAHGTWRQKDGSIKKKNCGQIFDEFGRRFNIWKIPAERHNTTEHPAVFPVSLVSDHIRTWSNEGDTVLDPFLGSGTTRIAAYDLGRDFIGCEIDKEYFDKQEERFERHTAQIDMFH